MEERIKIWIRIIGPSLFLFLYFINPFDLSDGENASLSIALWMIIWWLSEVVPFAVTALIPLILYPATGLMSLDQASESYSNSIIFLFLGGFLLATLIEKWKLHIRVSISILKITGNKAEHILLGFMLSTALLSMWISNTATAVMMTAIAAPLLNSKDKNDLESDFGRAVLLSIATGASIGGIATIIGTPPNAFLIAFSRKTLGTEIGFLNWLFACFPLMLVLLASAYFIYTKISFRKAFKANLKINLSTLHLEQKPMSGDEKKVALIFGLTALLWILREPLNYIFEKPWLDDTNIALAGGLIGFIIPAREKKPLLVWSDTEKLPWNILLLFGGGLCLAAGLEVGGWIENIKNFFNSLSHLDAYFTVIIMCLLMLILTELMSNIALVTILVPLCLGLAEAQNMEFMYLALPITLTASLGFMFPIGTPPNAIVFGTGMLKIKHMAKAGFWLDLMGLIWIIIFTRFWFPLFF